MEKEREMPTYIVTLEVPDGEIAFFESEGLPEIQRVALDRGAKSVAVQLPPKRKQGPSK
jgi:hypothetical protein